MTSWIDGYIFDLDGTLHDFWGVKFSESKLGQRVKSRYYDIIAEHSIWNPEEVYDQMLQREWEEKIGTSQQLADLIQDTREWVIRSIWEWINPEGVVEKFWPSQVALQSLSFRWKKIFLVTAAPRIWANNALEYMQLYGFFDQILSLEDFWDFKWDAFQKIISFSYIKPEKLMSVWDQEHSDIIPARALWINALLVSWPQDLHKLIS